MRLIAISSPEYFGGEASIVNELFERGLPLLHLNKPDTSDEELGVFVQQIRSTFYPRLTLHGHYDLAVRLGVGGIHLRGSNDLAPANWRGRLSTTCHTTLEATWRAKMMDYVLLGPVYPTPQEAHRRECPSRGQLVEAGATGLLTDKVVAVGGVNADRLPDLRQLGFKSAAISSALWGDRGFDEVIANYAKIVSILLGSE